MLKIAVLFLVFLPLSFAQESLLSPSLESDLSDLQVLLEYQEKFEGLRLLPKHALADEVIKNLQDRQNDTVVEVLTRIPVSSKKAQLELYNVLRSVSSMQGIEYYSVTYGRMRELFSESYVITDAKARTPVTDPLLSSVPLNDELLIMQKDTTFGENLYRAKYMTSDSDEAILLNIVNETTLRFNFLPIFEPSKLFTSMLIIPTSDSILFYGVITAKVPPIPFIKSRFQESLINRLMALRSWFEASLNAE